MMLKFDGDFKNLDDLIKDGYLKITKKDSPVGIYNK